MRMYLMKKTMIYENNIQYIIFFLKKMVKNDFNLNTMKKNKKKIDFMRFKKLNKRIC